MNGARRWLAGEAVATTRLRLLFLLDRAREVHVNWSRNAGTIEVNLSAGLPRSVIGIGIKPAQQCGALLSVKEWGMKRSFAATVWREGVWYVSQCLEVDVAGQGESEDEALANLKEALELHFEPPPATRLPKVRTIEVEVGAS